jgi:hypothetical protein
VPYANHTWPRECISVVAVEGADDMRNLLKVKHVLWLLQLLVSASGHRCLPLFRQKGERRRETIDLVSVQPDTKVKIIKYHNISKMPTASA